VRQTLLVAPSLPPRRRLRLGLACALLAMALGCGAQGTEAPHVLHPYEDDGQCMGSEEALAATRDQLKEGALSTIGPHVEEILVEDGGMRLVVPGLLLAGRAIGLENALSLTRGYEEGVGLARLKPHLLQVINYVTGESPYIDGEHFAVVDAVHRFVTGQGQGCDHLDSLGAMRRALALEITNDEGETVLWFDEAGDALVALVEDQVFQDYLDRFAFDEEDDGSSGVVVGREAFQLVMRLATSNVAQDNFDVSVVRGLLEDFLVFQLPEDLPEQRAARDKALRVVDLFEVILEPDLDLFPYLQSTLKCVNDVDETNEVFGMFFDYLSIEELSLVEFANDLDATAADDAGVSLRLFFSDGVEAMEGAPELSRDTLAVLNRFLEPQRTRDVFRAFTQLEGTGVFSELIVFVERMVRSCIVTDLVGDEDVVGAEGAAE
jgi:hypothetical protein